MTDNEDDLEMELLRQMVDELSISKKHQVALSEKVNQMIQILEQELRERRLICYGGTAINNILPKKDQFYDRTTDIPDYDFFSPDAMNDAIDIADIYVKHGFCNVEAKSGVHFGTYKIFVDFIPIADITQLPVELFEVLQQKAIQRKFILYAPPNYLRMAIYLELSRPDGDVGRWEKVLKRLNVLNRNYPMTKPKHCDIQKIHRGVPNLSEEENTKIFTDIRDILINADAVFFGGYSMSIYAQHMKDFNDTKKIRHVPDFDVLHEHPKTLANTIKEVLSEYVDNVEIKVHEELGEIIPKHYEVCITDKEIPIVFLYKPNACHSYNTVQMEGGHELRVATIDTILNFYLAFLYSAKPYHEPKRLLCMSDYLIDVRKKNPLVTDGVLGRFSANCIGHQHTLADIRMKKARMFRKLKKGTVEWNQWFLNYRPETHASCKSNKAITNKSDLNTTMTTMTTASTMVGGKKTKRMRNKKHTVKTHRKKGGYHEFFLHGLSGCC